MYVRVVPGFNDAHVHFADGGRQLVGVDLRDAGSPSEVARRIVERARSRPGEWITGGWWSPRQLLSRDLIDDGTNGTPVFVTSADGASALANSAAFGRAGITERTPDPIGGTIVRDARGLPTGVLRGTAMDAVARVVPKPSADERRDTILRALDHAASFGVTSAHDMNPDPDDLPVYDDLVAKGQLTTRLYEIPNEARWFEQARLGIRRAFGSPWLRLGGVAGDAGGAARNEMLTRLMAADHAGLQLCLNADAAGAGSALDLMTGVVRANGTRDRRMRIEHAERVTVAQTDRVTDVSAVMSVQLSAAPSADLFRRAADRRIAIAIGTDWPSAPLDPFLGLAAASRVTPVADAIRAYTRGSAFAEFQDTSKGALVRGALADLIILSDDVLHVPSDRIPSIVVVTTIVGGGVVHQRRP
jgi:predicted amidohydrolase YtcJ